MNQFSTYPIITNEEDLRDVCEEVSESEALEIIKLLKERMPEDAFGLSAPQIGIKKRVFITKSADKILSYVNTRISKLEDPYITREGCLSFPGKIAETIRYEKVSYSDGGGIKQLSGIEAHIFQHEQDHLDGVVMFDRLVPKKYDVCFCGSGTKYKFCCQKKLNDKKI